jgi:hypothetical protein
LRASEVCGDRFDMLWSGEYSGYESRSQADLALAGDLAFMCGPGEEERVEELMRQSGLDRPKWDRPDYLSQRTIPRAYEGREDFYRWEILPDMYARPARALVVMAGETDARQMTSELLVVEPTPSPSPDESSDGCVGTWAPRPTIVLGPETDAILAELEGHLAPHVFQRAGQLVQIIDQDGARGDDRCRRRAGSSVITPASVEQVQRLMSRHIRFVTPGASGEDPTGDEAEGQEAADGGGRAPGRRSRRRGRHQQAAPKNLAQLFAKCGQWEHIPHLKGLAASPYLRTDGAVVTTPGYDPVSGYYLVDTGVGWERVPDAPTAEDVQRAVRLLLDLVADFPFAGPQHLSAWVATLLAVAARPAIDGPVPMLWVDANRRGTGKSKLGRLIGIITGGRTPTELSWTPDEKEMENRLTALLGGGDNLAVFDNAAATIRNPVLERFLTCSEFDSRRFHRQELMKLPNRTTLVLNGNNLQLKGDLGRRVIRCRLETSMETPESREGFRYADIEAYAAANQPTLLAAALTILRAHAMAGFAACPVLVTGEDGTVTETSARSVGSYDEWDRVVRHAVLRAGLADPVVTQDEVTEEDEDDTKLRTLLRAWHLVSRSQPWTGTRLLEEVFGHEGRGESVPGREELAAALREITDTAPGKVPDPKILGYRLRDAKDKILGGYGLRKDSKGNKGVRYFVVCQDPACADCQSRGPVDGAA